jgi:hypothetical protein
VIEGYAPPVLPPAEEQAVEGRQTGRLGRPISDYPAALDGELRRAWRAGWLLGRDGYVENRAVHEAGVRACGRGAPRRADGAA